MKEEILDVYIKKYIRIQKIKYLSNKNKYMVNKLIDNNSKHFWRGCMWRTMQDRPDNSKSNDEFVKVIRNPQNIYVLILKTPCQTLMIFMASKENFLRNLNY